MWHWRGRGWGCTPPSLPLAALLLALAAGAGGGSGSPTPGGGGGSHNSSTGTAVPAVKDLGLSFSFGRGLELDGAIAAVFNKVAYGTTAAPTTTRHPTTMTSTMAAPTTIMKPLTTTKPTAPPPQPTEQVPLPPPPQPPPGPSGPVPTRRASAHPLPEYPPPNRPPPLPAEYNPFANKAILRGSQSDVGPGSGRKAPPQLLQPRPPPSELIPLPPVNTPSQNQGVAPRGHGLGGIVPTSEPRPERPSERFGHGSGRSSGHGSGHGAGHGSGHSSGHGSGQSSGHSGKHHLDSHVHTVASAPAPGLATASSGHQHDPHLKAAKPTELLDQVNKDPYIGVQAEGAVESDAAEENSAKVLVAPVTSPPPVAPPEDGPNRSPGPPEEWPVSWTAQVFYAIGSVWLLLALLSLCAMCIAKRTHLLPTLHFCVLLALLFTLATTNSVSMYYGGLWLKDPAVRVTWDPPATIPPTWVAASPSAFGQLAAEARLSCLMADLALPLLPAAFAVFFFVIMRVSHVTCSSSSLHNPALLAGVPCFLVACMSLEVASWMASWQSSERGFGYGYGYLHVAGRGLCAGAALLLGLAYACLYRPLRRAAAKKQAEQLRAAFTAFRRPPSPALPRVVNALLISALLLLTHSAINVFKLMDAHLLMTLRNFTAPPWLFLRVAEHVAALVIGYLLLWGAARARTRGSDERSGTSRSSRGTPGAVSLVSCAGKRFLFDCPSTGSEENKNSEDNTFPAVCASNHAILNYTQHTGNKLYDDSFPLANLPSAPLCSSGDDFSNVPTMPKRRPANHRTGTLIPAKEKSRRAGAPGLSHPGGHHTLGPGGQLYDDVSLRYEGVDVLKRGSRTTGRARKARHNKFGTRDEKYSNCPQDDEYEAHHKLDGLDGLADDFQVFKQYASTGSSESADNYDVPMLVSLQQAPDKDTSSKRHRRRGDRSEDVRPLHRDRERRARHGVHADSLSPASPSDLSDCDRLSSNRSSYDESAPMRPGAVHHSHRGKVLLRDRDVSEDDVTPDSAVVADITASNHHNHHSPREKRPAREAKRLARRQQQAVGPGGDSPSSPELYNSESVWSPQ